MPDPIEIVFYVHGVSNDPHGRSHDEQYKAMNDGIRRWEGEWPDGFGGAEWGWNSSGGRPRNHELLTDAQRQLGGRAMPAVFNPGDFTINPTRAVTNGFRPLFLYGFGDMFYYVSSDGKQSVRAAVASQIVDYLKQLRQGRANAPVSLTLLGHSAGSIVAFDFLFCLFFRKNGKAHEFLEARDSLPPRLIADLAELQQMAETGTLRIRRLITFGSPITPLACRSNAVLKILANDGQLDPKDYGLTQQPRGFPRLTGPRWINLWDRDDPIGWPVEPLMKQPANKRIVEDAYIDVSDLLTKAHDKYWKSKAVHKTIAKRW